MYRTKAGGDEWFLPDDPRTDPRSLERPMLTPNDDGSWKVHGRSVACGDVEVRWEIVTSAGFQESDIRTLDQTALATQGFILHPSDWKNVEMTAYYRIQTHDSSTCNGEAHIEHVIRGGRSTSDTRIIGGYPASCEATTYHANVYPITGRVKLEKDLQHTAGYTADSQDPQHPSAVPPFIDSARWVGIKTIIYNVAGDKTVRIEEWIDPAGDDQWTQALSYADEGSWGGGHPSCGGTDHTVITWGGPIAVFRADHLIDFDIRRASIREIEAP